MAALRAATLLARAAALAYLNVFFLLANVAGWDAAAQRFGALARRCGADTGSCALVAQTRWARVVPGVPNTVFGLVWCGALVWLAVGWLRAGAVTVPWWAHTGAAATVAAAALLIWALRTRVRRHCPL